MKTLLLSLAAVLGMALSSCSDDDNTLDDVLTTVEYTITTDQEDAELIIFATELSDDGVTSKGTYTTKVETRAYFFGIEVYCSSAAAQINVDIVINGTTKHSLKGNESVRVNLLVKSSTPLADGK